MIQWISELEDKIVEITSEEQNKVKRMKRTEDSPRDLWDNIRHTNIWIIGSKKKKREELRWQRSRTGEHFLPHKFIKITFKCWVNPTKRLLNAGRGHQASRKAAHCLRKEVGKNIKDKKRDKRGRDGAPSQEGSLKKREVSKYQETLSLPSLWRALQAQRAT